MNISMIVAMGQNRVIGFHNQIPSRLPAEQAYFRQVTMGHTVVMGRKNYESMGKPLAGRKNVVMTRDADFSAEGCEIAHSVQDVLERYAAEEVLFIIGGEEIYKQFLPFAQKLYVTVIEGEFAGDTFFPELDTVQWKEVSAKKGRTDEHNPLSYTYYVMESTKNGAPKEGKM